MTGHTYLMKSRHGVYYARLVLPEHKAGRLGRRVGELRTKSKEQAKLRLAETLRIMISKSYDLEPWELEADADRASYQRGLALVEQFGRLNPKDIHRLEAIHETLSAQEFRDYAYVHQYEAQLHKPTSQGNQAVVSSADRQAPATASAGSSSVEVACFQVLDTHA
jgi:hypothetical protein